MKIEHALGLLALLLLGMAGWLGWQSIMPAPPEPSASLFPLLPTATPLPPAPTPPPSPTPLPPTLADFWHGRALFTLEIADTGLPMGESETIIQPDGTFWSYVHASQQSEGIVDQCGDPVGFPGCLVIYRSADEGRSFVPPDTAVCQIPCNQCPCQSEIDHIDQQQYPRVAQTSTGEWLLVYEYRGITVLRRATDGLAWREPERVGYTGLWEKRSGCRPEEWIGTHPFTPFGADECLAGGPPGLVIEGEEIFVFVGLGQNPGSMGCFHGRVADHASTLQPCPANPLFTGARTYGPAEATGQAAHPFWDFRMISGAEILKVGAQYYMLYEGIRGPGPGDPGDTQFGLGLARTVEGRLDGRWETYPLNPILVDLPGNVGLGHPDLIIHNGVTYLYTSLDGHTRSRLQLTWR